GVLVPAEAERLLQRLLAAAELLAEVAREQEHVALAAAQGRQLDAGDGDAVQELVAETAGGDLAIEVGAGRHQQAKVRLRGDVGAEPLDAAALEDVEQLDLQGQVELGDLVDEQRAAVGALDHAGAAFGRAG